MERAPTGSARVARWLRIGTGRRRPPPEAHGSAWRARRFVRLAGVADTREQPHLPSARSGRWPRCSCRAAWLRRLHRGSERVGGIEAPPGRVAQLEMPHAVKAQQEARIALGASCARLGSRGGLLAHPNLSPRPLKASGFPSPDVCEGEDVPTCRRTY